MTEEYLRLIILMYQITCELFECVLQKRSSVKEVTHALGDALSIPTLTESLRRCYRARIGYGKVRTSECP